MSVEHEANLDPKMLEEYIVPQWSMSCGSPNSMIRNILQGSGLMRFILTNSLTLYVSDQVHAQMREADGIVVDDEICFGSYLPFIENGKILMQDDLRGEKPQTKVLTPIILKKMSGFMSSLDKHVAIAREARERFR